jgi:hypothetical protein
MLKALEVPSCLSFRRPLPCFTTSPDPSVIYSVPDFTVILVLTVCNIVLLFLVNRWKTANWDFYLRRIPFKLRAWITPASYAPKSSA